MIDIPNLLKTLKRLHTTVCDLPDQDENTASEYLLGYANAIQGTIKILEGMQHET